MDNEDGHIERNRLGVSGVLNRGTWDYHQEKGGKPKDSLSVHVNSFVHHKVLRAVDETEYNP